MEVNIAFIMDLLYFAFLCQLQHLHASEFASELEKKEHDELRVTMDNGGTLHTGADGVINVSATVASTVAYYNYGRTADAIEQ